KAFQDAGAYDDAIREFEAAFRLAPLPLLQFNIGQAQRLKGDKARAIEAYQRFLEVVPDGALSDEARANVATLKLKIEVEQAEAARKHAEEETQAARKRLEEESRRMAD